MKDHERWQDAAGSYVLGAMADEERASFEAHLQTCAECRAEVEELGLAAEALPVSAPPMVPPPALKARIMAEVEREAALLASAGQPQRPARKRRRAWWRLQWPTGAVAALACATALAGLGAGALVFAGGGERTVPMQSEIQRASASLEIGSDNTTLVARGLPPAPEGKVYMVWLQRPGQDPEPTSALFTPRADGSATASVPGNLDGVESVLVNTESNPGVTAPTSAPVLVATLA
jgi:hypothetical protein